MHGGFHFLWESLRPHHKIASLRYTYHHGNTDECERTRSVMRLDRAA